MMQILTKITSMTTFWTKAVKEAKTATMTILENQYNKNLIKTDLQQFLKLGI